MFEFVHQLATVFDLQEFVLVLTLAKVRDEGEDQRKEQLLREDDADTQM